MEAKANITGWIMGMGLEVPEEVIMCQTFGSLELATSSINVNLCRQFFYKSLLWEKQALAPVWSLCLIHPRFDRSDQRVFFLQARTSRPGRRAVTGIEKYVDKIWLI